jgi:hypothetical protein
MDKSKQLIKAYDSFYKKFGNYDFSYCDPDKKLALHRSGMRLCRLLASELEMSPGSFDVRSNKGGIAVSGEITLHHERLYVQVSQSCMRPLSLSWLIRSCKGKKDYSGGHNHHLFVTRDGLGGMLQLCRGILEKEVAR